MESGASRTPGVSCSHRVVAALERAIEGLASSLSQGTQVQHDGVQPPTPQVGKLLPAEAELFDFDCHILGPSLWPSQSLAMLPIRLSLDNFLFIMRGEQWQNLPDYRFFAMGVPCMQLQLIKLP